MSRPSRRQVRFRPLAESQWADGVDGGADGVDWPTGSYEDPLFESEDTTLVIVAASGATETIDCSVARTYDITLTANCTFTLTGAVDDEAHFLTLILRGTDTYTVTWPGSVEWADGSPPTLAGPVDFVTLLSVDGGTTWYGFPTGGGGGSALTIEDDGTPLATAATSLDFVGPGVTATGAGAAKTITIPGGATAADANIWRPVMDGAGDVVTDSGTGEAIMAYGPA